MTAPSGGARLAAGFAATVAFSAFLLFAVQPFFGRLALPRLGGAPAVWNTSLVFFQVALLAGYAYAHLLARRLAPRHQLLVHAAVIAAGGAFLPLALPAGGPGDRSSPALWLLGVMAVTIGPPFFALSANAPLLQAWFARASAGRRDPYPLYAASNAGSFLALIAYPFAIEPLLGLRVQAGAWAFGYAALGLLVLACGLAAARARAPSPEPGASPARAEAPGGERFAWLALAALPSSLLLGVTNHITTDIAAIPLFWVVPLAVYLLTFVVAFARSQPPGRALARGAVPFAVAILAFTAMFAGNSLFHLALHLAAFAVLALAAHTELAARRPAVARLTEFYLYVSAGGAIGGAATALLAPVIFPGVWEYPLAIAAACLIGARAAGAAGRASPIAIAVALALVASALGAIHLLLRDPAVTRTTIALVAIALPVGLFILRTHRAVLALAVAAVLLLAPQTEILGSRIFQARSFFGVHRVIAASDGRHHLLLHGATMHNAELADASVPPEPLGYYLRDGPIGTGLAALAPRLSPARIGVVGLGGGALACHAAPGQRWTFYEIDPLVERIARDPALLRSLDACGREASVVIGDGRLLLEREARGAFGLLIVDAFSSDAIPVHLLTREAIRLYLDRLAPNGVLFLHISNRYLRLDRVVIGIAREEGVALRLNAHAVAPAPGSFRGSSLWAALARDDAALAPLDAADGWREPDPTRAVRAWTDDFVDLRGVLR